MNALFLLETETCPCPPQRSPHCLLGESCTFYAGRLTHSALICSISPPAPGLLNSLQSTQSVFEDGLYCERTENAQLSIQMDEKKHSFLVPLQSVVCDLFAVQPYHLLLFCSLSYWSGFSYPVQTHSETARSTEPEMGEVRSLGPSAQYPTSLSNSQIRSVCQQRLACVFGIRQFGEHCGKWVWFIGTKEQNPWNHVFV